MLDVAVGLGAGGLTAEADGPTELIEVTVDGQDDSIVRVSQAVCDDAVVS